MSTPATIVRKLLLDLNLGEVTSEADWTVFVSFLPDLPDSALCVYDTAGRLDGRLMRTGEQIEHEGVQIRVRGVEYPVAWEKVNEIALALDGQINTTVEIAVDEAYTLHNASRSGAIIPLGQDPEDARRRHNFTINMTLTLSRNT